MAWVQFFEKRGCRANRKQRELLESLGHQVQVKDLLRDSWTPEALRPFFQRKPVSMWFNPMATAIRDGEIDPTRMSEPDALALMVREPILIKRPLVRARYGCCAGFERDPLLEYLGVRWNASSDLEACAADAPGGCVMPGEAR